MDSRTSLLGMEKNNSFRIGLLAHAMELERILDDLHLSDMPVRDCKADHGERTNNKLKDQPFYMRGKNGKMRNW